MNVFQNAKPDFPKLNRHHRMKVHLLTLPCWKRDMTVFNFNCCSAIGQWLCLVTQIWLKYWLKSCRDVSVELCSWITFRVWGGLTFEQMQAVPCLLGKCFCLVLCFWAQALTCLCNCSWESFLIIVFIFVYVELGAHFSLVLLDGPVVEVETSEIRYKMKAK